MKKLIIIFIFAFLLTGCSALNSIMDQTQILFVTGKVTNVVKFDFGHLLNKAQIVIVKFENQDPMQFISYKECEFYINDVNTLLYVTLPTEIETSLLGNDKILLPNILKYQLISVSRGGY